MVMSAQMGSLPLQTTTTILNNRCRTVQCMLRDIGPIALQFHMGGTTGGAVKCSFRSPFQADFKKKYISPTRDDDIFLQFTETFKKKEKGPICSVLAPNPRPREICAHRLASTYTLA